jgi:glycosyltransferase involved in cell wall biosynthesis
MTLPERAAAPRAERAPQAERTREHRGAAPLKVLACHNHYQQPGGEDESFEAEVRLLESHGHAVVRYTLHNDAIAGMSRWEAAARTLWNRQVYSELRSRIRRERPDVVHFTNTFPLISPAAHHAARREGVAVVQSLRNYRLLCPNALFLRNGVVCEDCLGKRVAWPGVLHACYRGDRSASAVVASMLAAHKGLGTWSRAVDVFVTPSAFARDKFVQGGLPESKIVVKPNFVDPDPGPGSGDAGDVVFVGRLAPEKGVHTLLGAWRHMPPGAALQIVGDGPLADDVRRAEAADLRITWRGRRELAEAQAIVGRAACLVMPSLCYETFGRTIVEAFAKGTPVVASRRGAMSELVAEGSEGLLFEPGDERDLAAKLQWLLSRRPGLDRMRQAARRKYEGSYTAAANHAQLLAIYERASGATGPRGKALMVPEGNAG